MFDGKFSSKLIVVATVVPLVILACNSTIFGTDQPVATPTTEFVAEGSPSETVCTAQVVEQSFENGFMFWIGRTSAEKCAPEHSFEPGTGEIWVAYVNAKIPFGKWQVLVDDWTAGVDPESDSSLVPPAGLFQPVRGFGKVWRSGLSTHDRELLGWATGTEFLISSEYRYEGGEFTNNQGEVIHRPGKHILVGLAGDKFTFDEVSQTVVYTPPPSP